MSEENNQQNSAKKNPEKKKQFLLTKIVIFLALIFFGYFGFKFWKVQQEKRLQAKQDIEKFDNVESDIFDLSDEYKNAPQADDLSDMTVSEIKEKGAEFIYQLLLKNQVQLEDLKGQVRELKGEFLKYKNHEKIGKMIFIYVDLREKIFAGKNYLDSLKSFEIISASDATLQNKVDKLEKLLPSFSPAKKLSESFQSLIPDLISSKEEKSESGVLAKIRRNIARLVVIRRIDGGDPKDVDFIIAKIEKALVEENYQEALNAAISFDSHHQEILKKFLADLGTSLEVQKTDQEILNYLKSLT